jgi:diacylglycerol kinase family enzyme
MPAYLFVLAVPLSSSALRAHARTHACKRAHAQRMRDVVLPFWRVRGIEVTELHTLRVRHGWELAASVDLTGVDGVIACGGDGSLHDVVRVQC